MQNTLVRLRPRDKFVTFPEFKKIKNFQKKIWKLKKFCYSRAYIYYIFQLVSENSRNQTQNQSI